jgi:hypothetical protein
MTSEELKELSKDKLMKECKDFIPILHSLIKEIEYNNLQNEEWFLDFLDELNTISVSW